MTQEELNDFIEILQHYDVFDEEDIANAEKARTNLMKKGSPQSEKIAALEYTLRERQKILNDVDKVMNLVGKFPEMMEEFAAKDAYTANLIEVEKKAEALRK